MCIIYMFIIYTKVYNCEQTLTKNVIYTRPRNSVRLASIVLKVIAILTACNFVDPQATPTLFVFHCFYIITWVAFVVRP